MEKYENLIRERANDQPVPYWFNLGLLHGKGALLPDWLVEKLNDAAEEFFPDCEICCGSTFTRNSIFLIWNTVIGANVDNLYRYFSSLNSEDNFADWIIDLRHNIIDGSGGSMECDDMECCSLTGEVLESYGCNGEMIEEEINCIAESGSLYQRDFDFLDLVIANYDIKICKPLFPLFEKEIELLINQSIT